MKFSIVTLAFRQREFLQEAMDSILNQDYPEIEYIVVEPGSNDGSRELIEGYGDKIAHKVFEPDRGAADGLNKGFARATGDIFGFLNGDDLLLPGALRKVADFWQSHPEYDILMGDGFIADHAGKPVRRVKATAFTPSRFIYGGATWLQQSTFFRRKAFEAVGGFNLQNRSCWDGELFVNMVAKGFRVGFLHEDLSIFRIHGASITGSRSAEQIYAADTARIFRQLRGRDRRQSDALLSLWYRAERFLRDPGELVHTLRYRIQGRPQ
ncbi:MAG TPA: glycosyltransferase family 2 protein [Acidisarcina sp.]|nr:glycosyltransferase family 2 protein [Acidisarcina sp.]